tara:strand:- start:351 stop:1076 length:726 start_codon:yes stop_codon:yes gene_type:complete
MSTPRSKEKAPFTLKSLLRLCSDAETRDSDPNQFYWNVDFKTMATVAVQYLNHRNQEQNRITDIRSQLSNDFSNAMLKEPRSKMNEDIFEGVETGDFFMPSQFATQKVVQTISLETYISDFLKSYCIQGINIFPVSVIHAPEIANNYLFVACLLQVDSKIVLLFAFEVPEKENDAFKDISTLGGKAKHIPADFWVNEKLNSSYKTYKDVRGVLKSYKFAPRDIFDNVCFDQHLQAADLALH